MTAYVLRRFVQSLVVLLGVATVVFLLVRLTGDPVRIMLPPDATVAQEDALRGQLGLDRSLVVQYFEYLGNLLRLDMGESLFFHQPVSSVIAERGPATLQLALGAFVFALLVAIPAGIYSALHRGRVSDSAVSALVLAGQSTPAFWVGILLILIFPVQLNVLSAAGIGGIEHLILPSITLGLYTMAIIARMLRSSLIDVLDEDYIRTAKAKGLSGKAVVAAHGLRNAAPPVVTVIGLELGGLLGGAIVTEKVFAWPGLGRLTVDAIENRDFPLVQGVILLFAATFVVVNLLVDLCYAWLDPRIRLEAQ
ncbi:MAG: ABC transporter permease [Actinomycetia bacterium]|nr:ABC transporter permease [Actinomycetes bacterium]